MDKTVVIEIPATLILEKEANHVIAKLRLPNGTIRIREINNDALRILINKLLWGGEQWQ